MQPEQEPAAERNVAGAPRADPAVELFDRRLTAADLCSVPFFVSADMSIEEARRALEERGYAAAPVAGTSPPTMLHLTDLAVAATAQTPALAPPSDPDCAAVETAEVAELARPVPAASCVGLHATLPEVFDGLRRFDMLVVVGERSTAALLEPAPVLGIITRRDLVRPGVGLAVLGLLVRTEPGLDALIDRYSNGRWEALMSEGRRKKLASVGAYLRRPGLDLGRMTALNLDDRLTLVGKLPELRSDLGFSTGGAFHRFAEPLRRMRDALAHAGSVLDAVPDPLAAIDLIGELRRLVDAVDALARGDSDAKRTN